MIASSSSSPAMRTLWLVTIPPREMTATSVVPPPMSTTMLPVGSCTGSPAPIAAAIGSPTVEHLGAPAAGAAAWPGQRAPAADRGCHRLLDGVDLARAGLVARLLDRPLLHAGDARGHAHDD